jgi:cytochrome c biogenesis protein CcmG, thiol:disulfide interchange protein DsbE
MADGAVRMSRALRFAPLALLVAIIAALVWRLATPADTNVHSTLEGKPVPAFDLGEILPNKPALTSADLANGSPHLVNVFASWCVPCVTEVKALQMLKSRGVRIEGIAVRDRAEDLADFLARNGDPYERIGDDPQSRVQISLGSSGVPESFVVDGKGVIRYQQIGPIEPGDVPMILAKLEQAR